MSDENKNTPASKEDQILDLLKRVDQKLSFLEAKVERLLQQSQSVPRSRERSSERFSPRDQKRPYSKPFRPGGNRPTEERDSRYGAKKPSFKKKKFAPRKDRP